MNGSIWQTSLFYEIFTKEFSWKMDSGIALCTYEIHSLLIQARLDKNYCNTTKLQPN